MFKRYAAAFAALATSSAFISVLTFENQTNLAHRWETDRQSVTAKIQANQTSRDGFDKAAFDVNVTQIDEYSDAYKCASKIDTTKCRSAATY